ncbi:hypothetical protein SAMN05444422_11820 [Halobiforma haloterrestris]|uniref:Uncharacterized protein n=1 Tax=Natronobacterium haloterrestre TaxID=148448 RepID=A0A1I1LKP2_NATHA|nr:DUF5830 family protein [Halobiforma haloterrestris]SFC73526.1 hypothetical protein SAMN05444422_11820 [Halobiforma haloterrestris]
MADEGDEPATAGEPDTTAGAERTDDDPDGDDRHRHRHPDDRVELGLALLERLEHESLPLPEAVDRIETVTTDPTATRTILDEAELRGIIDREDGIVRPKSRQYVSFDRDVITKEGEFTCRRCGSGLSTGYFVDLEAGELGPFGSSCIRKVTGRE